MKAADIKDLTVAGLQEAVTMMMTFDWHKEIAKLPTDDERNDAKKALANCQGRRLFLENAELAEIRDKLKENEEDLEKGRGDLKKALKDLQKVKAVLDAVNSLLSIVARIVA
jgi:hypothetical protein